MIHINYLWQKFNIKTFVSETVVFLDGVFMPELSTITSTTIDKKYEKPVHIIYVGEICGEKNIDIDVLVPDTNVFLTVKIKNEKPAFLNIFIKNAGKNSVVKSKILVQNYSNLEINENCNHLSCDTTILINTKIIGHKNSDTKIIGIANILKNCENCISDIVFSAVLDKIAKIQFLPQQKISCPPQIAGHSAFIYRGGIQQIEYLRESGLSLLEIKELLESVYINDDLIF